jgi:hypothetical protein
MGSKLWVPAPSGPLAPYAAGFSLWLRSRSYSLSAAANRLWQLDQLSRWLARSDCWRADADARSGVRNLAP